MEMPDVPEMPGRISRKEKVAVCEIFYKETTKLVQKVNKFIEDSGIPPGLLKLKTEQDYLLYFKNYMDEANRFKGRITIDSIYYIDLINYLVDTDEKEAEFLKLNRKEGNINLSISRYRMYLRRNRELNINEKLLQECMDTKDWIMFSEKMEELWLEPMHISWLDSFKKAIILGLTGQDILNYYKKYSNNRMISIVTFNLDYLRKLSKID